MSNSEFDPSTERRPLKIKTSFNDNVRNVIKTAEEENRSIELPMLLCPAYPSNGSQFTYESGMMTGDICPTLPLFQRETDKLFSCIYQAKFNVERVHIRPMVCEIESDLPNVIDKFAKGDQNYFNNCIDSTMQKSTEYLRQRYPYAEVTGSNFNQGIPTLSEDREFIENVILNLENLEGMPKFLETQLDYVSKNRNHMFTQLYSAHTQAEFNILAKRQMINYLAVTRGLARTYPSGCIVFNVYTPNKEYVVPRSREDQQKLRQLLRLEKNQLLPTFYFF